MLRKYLRKALYGIGFDQSSRNNPGIIAREIQCNREKKVFQLVLFSRNLKADFFSLLKSIFGCTENLNLDARLSLQRNSEHRPIKVNFCVAGLTC